MVLPITVRFTDRMAADSATSGRNAKLFDGAPLLVLPPCAMNKVFVAGSSARPLDEWFSSDRGRPRTRSSFVQLPPDLVSRDSMLEFVSRLVSVAAEPPPMRGSLDVT